MSIRQRSSIFLLGALMAGLCCTAESRPWKPAAAQIAGDYADIQHARSATDFVTIRWWAPPTVASGTPLAGILEKYIVISIVHFHVNQPDATITFDEIDRLEAYDGTRSTCALANSMRRTSS
jgi:hypothetical protein